MDGDCAEEWTEAVMVKTPIRPIIAAMAVSRVNLRVGGDATGGIVIGYSFVACAGQHHPETGPLRRYRETQRSRRAHRRDGFRRRQAAPLGGSFRLGVELA